MIQNTLSDIGENVGFAVNAISSVESVKPLLMGAVVSLNAELSLILCIGAGVAMVCSDLALFSIGGSTVDISISTGLVGKRDCDSTSVLTFGILLGYPSAVRVIPVEGRYVVSVFTVLVNCFCSVMLALRGLICPEESVFTAAREGMAVEDLEGIPLIHARDMAAITIQLANTVNVESNMSRTVTMVMTLRSRVNR